MMGMLDRGAAQGLERRSRNLGAWPANQRGGSLRNDPISFSPETWGMRQCMVLMNIEFIFPMAAIRIPSAGFLSAFLPIVHATLQPHAAPIARRLPLLQQLRTSLIPAAFLPIPSLLEQIWDGLLKAVPKKKTSHMKKRHRQMAGKALKDVTALNKCSACGRVKRAHVLCPYCVQSKIFQ